MKLWQSLSSMETDPFPAVAWLAHTLLDYVRDQVEYPVTIHERDTE